jgi:uncharacterized membrane protein YedE/YeeE
MRVFLKKLKLSPYTTGAIIGLCFLAGFFLFSKTLPTCASFVKLGALINVSFGQNQAEYFKSFLQNAPHWFDWPLALASGLFLGSFISSKLSESKVKEDKLSGKTKLIALAGGFLILFGSRFAGGCISGHLISSASQMAASSHMFILGLAIIGVPAAYITSKLIKEDN